MKKHSIKQYKDGKLISMEDTIAQENILHLVINSDISFDVIISPNDIKDFVYGNLFTEGFIHEKSEVTSYKETIKKSLISVKIKLKDFEHKKVFLKKNYNIVWTECGSGGELARLADQFKPLDNFVKVKADDLLTISTKIQDKIEHFKETGAFHYAFIFDTEINLMSYSYDIGRHNAVDKAVGQFFLDEKSLADKLLFVTGRISSDILLKCLRAKIPLVLSRSAPLDVAVELANKYNIGLIGFLRGKRFNVYSNSQAIY